MKVTIKDEWFESINQLPEKVRLEVLGAMVLFLGTETRVKMTRQSEMVFNAYIPLMQKAKDVSVKRGIAGKKGMDNRYVCYNKDITKLQQKFKEKVFSNIPPHPSFNSLPREDKKSIDKSIQEKKKFDFRQALIDSGADSTYVDEWIRIRKSKGGVNTEIAFKTIVRECKMAGISIADAVRMTAENQWCGFKASYLNNNRNGNSRTSIRPSIEERMRGYAETIFGSGEDTTSADGEIFPSTAEFMP